jgi:DNA-binding transcriptional regulator LsrR (DeoR family)
MPNSDNRLEYLARIASLYYDQRKTQQEVADEIGITRSTVSRLITEAQEKGIVEHIVHYPWRTNPVLEKALITTFNLKDAIVLSRQNKTYEEMLSGIGYLAGQYFLKQLRLNSKVGVSWGTGLHQLIKALRPVSRPDVEIIQLIGGTGSETGSQIGPLLAPMLANTLGCTCRYIHAPLMMENETGRDTLLQEKSIRETLQYAEKCNIALVGVGSTNPLYYNPYKLGYVTDEEIVEISRKGGVGSTCGEIFNLKGELLDIDINRRIVGIGLETLSKIEYVVGVAGGSPKAEAIVGALEGKIINVLVTDDQAAEAIMKLKTEMQ